ncbi:hypothetical protein [Mangrovicella endophytica]|uniref:hypothetical protein n=1 Tax=Mangrovicella endophytica TaxID=2066697 RepID=UPI0012FFE09B|nr:hypothetical protein [Mangrovicella endophytica]
MSVVIPSLLASSVTRPGVDGIAGHRPLRCIGDAILPTPLAVDVARILDTDGDVERWASRRVEPLGAPLPGVVFDVVRASGHEQIRLLEDGATNVVRECDPDDVPVRVMGRRDIDPVRLENAKLILPYARWRVSLDDRIRLLAVVDEEGSVTLGECLSILRNTSRPIAAVASLALARVVDLELDAPLGSRTRVIRRPD